MNSKEVVIIQHNPSTGINGQLANQLWNFISIYAYSLEIGAKCLNYSFFEFSRHFCIPVGNIWIDNLIFKPFNFLIKFIPERSLIPLWRKIYKVWTIIYLAFDNKIQIISDSGPYYLPPSEKVPLEFLSLDLSKKTKLYFSGWLFRNPIGIIKYRNQIVTHFRPNKKIDKIICDYIKPIREKFKTVIGLHIRQGDYVQFKGGKYYVTPERARIIVDQFINNNNIDNRETALIITSNGPINEKIFDGLNVYISKHSGPEDLFILSACDIIVGSDSTFGNFASYYGNIPHIVMTNEDIDWKYYKNRTEYFQNKYCTLVQA